MIFVTGGTGLLGAHLLFDLAKRGEKVRALKRAGSNTNEVKNIFHFYSPEAETIYNRIDWVDGDILDIYSLLDAMEGATYVYHCAAVVSFATQDANDLIKINVEGTANVVNACLDKQIKKLCYVSSVAALGATERDTVLTEKITWKSDPTHSVYGISKYGGEREVWRGSEEGLDVIIVNPSVIIGPGNWDKSSALLFKRFYKGVPFYTNGITGFVDVRDVVRAMIGLTESTIKNERFIVSAENLSYKRIFNEMATAFSKRAPQLNVGTFITSLAWRVELIRTKLTGAQPIITKEISRAIHQQRHYNSDKLIKALEFRFTSIHEAIKHTAGLFLKKARQ